MKYSACLAVLLASSLALAGCDPDKHDQGGGHDHGDEHAHGDEHGHEGDHHDDHGDEHEHGPGHEGDHDHKHGQAGVVAITRWGEKIELYAEYEGAVTGEEVSLLIHLTVLETFKPLTSGKVEVSLSGPMEVSVKNTAMLRAGIFQSTFKAPAPGKYELKLAIDGDGVKETLSGIEVLVFATDEEAKKKLPPEAPEGVGEPISFLKERQWQIPFGTALAKNGLVVPSIEVAGEITTPPGGQADVGAAISGQLIAGPQGFPHPGQAVKKGQLLATIAPAPAAPEEAARAELSVVEAKARLEAARSRVSRAERLIKDGAIAQKEVDDAHREQAVAEDSVKAAERARSIFAGAQSGQGSGTYRVTTPIAGTVVDVQATSGKPVQAGDPLFRVVSTEELWIQARVPEQAASRLHADQDSSFKLPGLETWLPLRVTGETPNARVVNVGRVVSSRSRTVDLIYGLSDTDERLRVGAMVSVAVPVGTPWKGVVVPRSAVLDSEGQTIVYVQLNGEAFDERVVRVAQRSGDFFGLESGVKDGEHVVTEGANVIRLTTRADSGSSHGHVH